MNGVTYVSDSKNHKLFGSKKIDATYASVEATCPKSCKLRGDGCYAELGNVGIHTKKFNLEAKKMTALEVARAEARAIDNSYSGGKVPEGRMLRINVAGDSRTIKGTRLINSAIKRWKKRGGGQAYAYTHAYRHVPRKEWNNVSVLASVDSISDVKDAIKMGYAPAIVIPEHTTEKAFKLKGSDVTWIPCPNQTKPGGKEIGCSDCKLCMRADFLYETNRGIAFAAHGVAKEKIKRRLKVL